MFRKLADKRVVSAVGFLVFAVVSEFYRNSQVRVTRCNRVRKLANHGLPSFQRIGRGVGRLGLLALDRLDPEIEAASKQSRNQEGYADEDFLFVKRPKNFGIKRGNRVGRLRRGLATH